MAKQKNTELQDTLAGFCSLHTHQQLPPKSARSIKSKVEKTGMASESSLSEAPSSPNNIVHATNESTPMVVGSSMVSDLMSIYESLTQSSTPHSPQQQKLPSPRPAGSDPQYSIAGHQLSQEQMPAPLHPSESHAISLPSTDQPYPSQYPQQIQYHHHSAPQAYGEQAYSSYPQNYGAQAYAPPAEPLPQQAQSSDESDAQSYGTRSRKKRGGSTSDASVSKGSSKGRKKSKPSDGRWSKRFTWPDDLHRDFVSAIFDVGLKHSSPSTILEQMPKHPDMTTERIKSHLQKYRLNRAKAKQEFMSSYEASLLKFQEKGTVGAKSLSEGEVAAHLTHASTADASKMATAAEPLRAASGPVSQSVGYSPHVNEVLMLPQLTEAEKNSPIGASMGYLMGLFLSLKQQLAVQRGGNGAGVKRSAPVTTNGSVVSVSVQPSGDAAHQKQPQQHGFDPIKNGEIEHNPAATLPSSTKSLEENSLMKQEMKNQRVFQNKMRALKQQEFKKSQTGKEEVATPAMKAPEPPTGHADASQNRVQFAAEPRQEGRPSIDGEQLLAIGNSDDFWNTDVVDEQLFEFLMNN